MFMGDFGIWTISQGRDMHGGSRSEGGSVPNSNNWQREDWLANLINLSDLGSKLRTRWKDYQYPSKHALFILQISIMFKNAPISCVTSGNVDSGLHKTSFRQGLRESPASQMKLDHQCFFDVNTKGHE